MNHEFSKISLEADTGSVVVIVSLEIYSNPKRGRYTVIDKNNVDLSSITINPYYMGIEFEVYKRRAFWHQDLKFQGQNVNDMRNNVRAQRYVLKYARPSICPSLDIARHPKLKWQAPGRIEQHGRT